jgi:hypothetical protein
MKALIVVLVMVMGLVTATGNLWVIEHESLAHQVDSMRQYNGLSPIPEAQQVFHSSDSELLATPGPWEMVGQNVGKATRIWLVVRALMDSPTHREIMLDDWSAVGYGHIRAADGNVYVTLWFRR